MDAVGKVARGLVGAGVPEEKVPEEKLTEEKVTEERLTKRLDGALSNTAPNAGLRDRSISGETPPTHTPLAPRGAARERVALSDTTVE